jgi:hypothetical protein
MHALTSPIKLNRFTAELERLWDERPRTAYWRLARSCPGKFVKGLDSLIGFFVPKLTNATRMLKEQLRVDGVGVWVSAGCLAEFARIASLAAARTRQGDESYESCLRREIVTHSRFIREWTSSDEKFDPTRGELISIARRYALPRAWRVSEAVASVRVARPRPRGIRTSARKLSGRAVSALVAPQARAQQQRIRPRSGLDILVPRLDREPFARSKGFDLVTLRRQPQPAATLLPSADPQISDCCLHREALPVDGATICV